MKTKILYFIKAQGYDQLIKCVTHKLNKKWTIVKDRLLLKVDRLHILPNYKIGAILPLDFTIAKRYDYRTITQLFAGDVERICSEADTICRCEFSLLGSDVFALKSGSDWHLDFKSGFQWQLDYYREIQHALNNPIHFNNNADIKVPWELSRCQFLPILAQAYHLTGNHKYYDQFKQLVKHWTENNPYKQGPNWISPMDVAIRIVNWIVAAESFADDLTHDKAFNQLFNQQIIAAGHFIANNIERDIFGHGNNHYLSNLVGLIFIGIHLRDAYHMADKWSNQGIRGLLCEIDYQVHDDGGGFEGSLSYHRFSTEMFLMATILLARHGKQMSKYYLKKLEKMCEFVARYLKPNGKAPIFGDADDGRLLTLGTFYHEDKRDHRHLLATAGTFFNRPDWVLLAGDQTCEARWLFGGIIQCSQQQKSNRVLYSYVDTGVHIYRASSIYLAIKCGSIGLHGRGGHDHNDQLSFELNIAGTDIVVDCGSYVYTADKDKRQHFRSIASHNVAQHQHYEQNTINCAQKSDLFKMDSANAGELLKMTADHQQLHFKGRIRNQESAVYTYRTITCNLDQQYIEVCDWFENAVDFVGNVSRMHLASDVDVIQENSRIVLLKTPVVEVRVTGDSEIVIEPCLVSPSYGRADPSKRLSFKMLQCCNYRLSYQMLNHDAIEASG